MRKQFTPIYNASEMPAALSPMAMWPDIIQQPSAVSQALKQIEGIKEAQKSIPQTPQEVHEQADQEAYERLTETQKSQIAAAIVLSRPWKIYLKPYLESHAQVARRPILSDGDFYRNLNENAISAFCSSLISDLERRARSSPAYNVIEDEPVQES